MSGVKELKAGDPCPACGGDLKAAAVATDDQYRRAFDKENPQALPPGMDTANPDNRAELGALHRCGGCGYQARFKADQAPAAGKRNGAGKPRVQTLADAEDEDLKG